MKHTFNSPDVKLGIGASLLLGLMVFRDLAALKFLREELKKDQR